jgi:methyl-accepting chemotaxis protein
MNSFLSNRSIRTKLALMLLLPILGLLYFSGAAVLEKSGVVDNLHSLQSLTHLAIRTSAVIHELQKERGLSAGFIGSGGEKFAGELNVQRAVTDRKATELQSFIVTFDTARFDEKFGGTLNVARLQVEKLGEMRSSITGLKVSGKGSFDAYTAIIASLLDVTFSVTNAGKQADMVRLTTSYYMLLNGKERAGRERATLNAVFAANRFEPESLQRFVGSVAQEDTYFGLFAANAPTGVAAFYLDRMAGAYSAEVGLDRVAEGNFGVEPKRWFDAITLKINAMKEVEDKFSAELDDTVSQNAGLATRQLWFAAGLTLVSLTAALLLSWLVATSILRPVRSLHTTMLRLRESDDLTLRAETGGHDEIGQMATVFNGMIAGFQEIVSSINQNAQQVAGAATQLAAAAKQVNEGSHAQSEATAASAAAIEQVSVSADMVTASANEVSDISRDSLSRAQDGNQSLSQLFGAIDVTENAVSCIADSVEEFIKDANNISRLTQEVRDIAEQTNLLALNAAIEAARAGDQGRGFAVVADEVRKLAEKSALSANEIDVVTRAVNQQSEALQSAVKDGVDSLHTSQNAAEDVAMVMAEATKSVGNTSAGINNIADSVKEQNAAMNDLARNVEHIAQMTEENSFAVDTVSDAAANLQHLAVGLQEKVGKFRY